MWEKSPRRQARQFHPFKYVETRVVLVVKRELRRTWGSSYSSYGGGLFDLGSGGVTHASERRGSTKRGEFLELLILTLLLETTLLCKQNLVSSQFENLHPHIPVRHDEPRPGTFVVKHSKATPESSVSSLKSSVTS